eukprot:m.280313 g.280313  ORF g.280313 m.280313 type:complete len:328 (+) comp11104_c0_seq13:1528-2511(+)
MARLRRKSRILTRRSWVTPQLSRVRCRCTRNLPARNFRPAVTCIRKINAPQVSTVRPSALSHSALPQTNIDTKLELSRWCDDWPCKNISQAAVLKVLADNDGHLGRKHASKHLFDVGMVQILQQPHLLEKRLDVFLGVLSPKRVSGNCSYVTVVKLHIIQAVDSRAVALQLLSKPQTPPINALDHMSPPLIGCRVCCRTLLPSLELQKLAVHIVCAGTIVWPWCPASLHDGKQRIRAASWLLQHGPLLDHSLKNLPRGHQAPRCLPIRACLPKNNAQSVHICLGCPVIVLQSLWALKGNVLALVCSVLAERSVVVVARSRKAPELDQ